MGASCSPCCGQRLRSTTASPRRNTWASIGRWHSARAAGLAQQLFVFAGSGHGCRRHTDCPPQLPFDHVDERAHRKQRQDLPVRRPGWIRSAASGGRLRKRSRPASLITPPGANSSSDISPRAARSISPRVIWMLKACSKRNTMSRKASESAPEIGHQVRVELYCQRHRWPAHPRYSQRRLPARAGQTGSCALVRARNRRKGKPPREIRPYPHRRRHARCAHAEAERRAASQRADFSEWRQWAWARREQRGAIGGRRSRCSRPERTMVCTTGIAAPRIPSPACVAISGVWLGSSRPRICRSCASNLGHATAQPSTKPGAASARSGRRDSSGSNDSTAGSVAPHRRHRRLRQTLRPGPSPSLNPPVQGSRLAAASPGKLPPPGPYGAALAGSLPCTRRPCAASPIRLSGSMSES